MDWIAPALWGVFFGGVLGYALGLWDCRKATRHMREDGQRRIEAQRQFLARKSALFKSLSED